MSFASIATKRLIRVPSPGRRRNVVQHCLLAAVATAMTALICGCGKREEIQSYTFRVAKSAPRGGSLALPEGHPPIGDAPQNSDKDSDNAAAKRDGSGNKSAPAEAAEKTMLAALIPHAGQAWAFKVTGETAILEKFADQFDAFIQTVKFSDDKPDWKLPDGWKVGPPRQFGFATLQVADPAVEIAVSAVNQSPDFLAQNVNRWRGQLGLAPLEGEAFAQSVRTLKLEGDLSATVVKLTGKLQSGGMSRPPFAPQGGRNGK